MAILLSIIPFFTYCVYDFIISKEPGFAFFSLVIECLTLLVVLIYIFYEKMQYSYDIPIHQTHFFWVAVAFIIYFAGNFFLFLYSKNIHHDEAFRQQYTIIYSIVTVIKDSLLCISTFISEKNKSSSSPPPIPDSFDSFLPFKN